MDLNSWNSKKFKVKNKRRRRERMTSEIKSARSIKGNLQRVLQFPLIQDLKQGSLLCCYSIEKTVLHRELKIRKSLDRMVKF